MKFLYILIFSLFFAFSVNAAKFKYGGLVIQHNEITASGGTTTLTITSKRWQDVTGSNTHTIVLYDAQTAEAGDQFHIANHATGSVTIQYNDNSTALTLEANTFAILTLTDNTSTNGTWEFRKEVREHSQLNNLTNDDHTQYALLAGRSGGQTLKGGTGAGEDLTLNSTSNASKGDIVIGSTEALAFTDYSASPRVHAVGDDNTGLAFPGSDTIDIYEGGTSAIRIDSDQQIGFYDSTPDASYDFEGTDFLFPTPSSEPDSSNFSNGQSTVWLDEVNDQFELKAKKSDGTVITQTVGQIATGALDHDQLGGLTDDDHSQYIYNAPTTTNRNLIQPGANVPALKLRSQDLSYTADLMQWQDNAGNNVASMNPNGVLEFSEAIVGNVTSSGNIDAAGTIIASGNVNFLGTNSIFAAPNTEIADASFQPGQYSVWLDEINQEFEIKGMKQNGTLFAKSIIGADFFKDGSAAMTGDLDLGSNALSNATNITASGTIIASGNINSVGTNFLLPAPSAAPADSLLQPNQITAWLDETNNEFELKAMKSNGNIISQTVGSGSSGGSLTRTAKTSTYTAACGDLVDADASGGDFTVTLPTASGNENCEIFIKNTGSSGVVTVDGNGSETIDQDASIYLTKQDDYIKVFSDGTNFLITDFKTNWFISANIGGASVAMSTSNVTSYSALESSSLDMVINTGSITSEIPCSTGNASSGLDCSASSGTEQIGVAIVQPPIHGYYEVCIGASHQVQVQGSGANVNATFQVNRTANTSLTITESGLSKAMSFYMGEGTNNSYNAKWVRVCGEFELDTTDTRATFRLMREQSVSATVNENVINADRNTSAGQRDIEVTVRLLGW